MCYLIVNVLEEGEASPPAESFDGCVITSMDFECHGASRSKQLGANKVGIYALLV